MFHYTDKDGYAVRANVNWLFKEGQPPGGHPFGAYFTSLPEGTTNLAKRLGIPKRKTEFVFGFTGGDDLLPLKGDRGRFIFYSPNDYLVAKGRQFSGYPIQRAI